MILPETAPTFAEQLPGVEASLPLTWVTPSGNLHDRIAPSASGWRIGSITAADTFVGRRQQHLAFIADATFGSHVPSRLELRIDPRHRFAVEQAGSTFRVLAHIGGIEAELASTQADATWHPMIQAMPSPAPQGSVLHGPDELVGGISNGEEFLALARLDGRYLSTEVAGGFTGRMIGVNVPRGSSIVTSFSYRERRL